MTLQEFVDGERKRLDAFYEYWDKNNKTTPELFPLKLNEGMWQEMFYLYDYSQM